MIYPAILFDGLSDHYLIPGISTTYYSRCFKVGSKTSGVHLQLPGGVS